MLPSLDIGGVLSSGEDVWRQMGEQGGPQVPPVWKQFLFTFEVSEEHHGVTKQRQLHL